MPTMARRPRFAPGLERLGLRYAVAIRWFLVMWTPGARRAPAGGSRIAAPIPDARLAARHLGRQARRARWPRVRRRCPVRPGQESWPALAPARAPAGRGRAEDTTCSISTPRPRCPNWSPLARSRWPIEQQTPSSRTNWASTISKADPSRLDASHGPHRDRVHVPPVGTPAGSRRRASSDAADRPTVGARDHGALRRQ